MAAERLAARTHTPLRFLVASLLALLLARPTLACRCVPQTLDHYFERADLVMVARTVSTRIVKGSPDFRTAEFAPVQEPYKGDPKSIVAFATHLSSASCGVPVEAGQMFLIFAARDEPGGTTAWFDSCNGTRPFGPDVKVVDFVDTPAEKILLRLEGLRTANAVRDPSANPGGPRLPKPGHPHAELIGLLELVTVLNLDEPGASSPPPRLPSAVIEVMASPESGAAVVAQIRLPTDIITRELDYERKAAVVLEQRAAWYRIALPHDRSGWLSARLAGPFHPFAELIVNRLSYLTAHWDGWIWPDPGAGNPVNANVKQSEGRHEYPVNVRGTQDLAGTLWLQVEILSASPCEGGSPKTVISGWVPAYSPEGKLTAWFYSRGC
ncbi:MAG: hypothetical protein HY699_17800 [Deltaproteobacteria bacterium]|nr:hypothetical protein [Deltaproteobacteria bacterium]